MIKVDYDKSKYYLFYHGSPCNFDVADVYHSKEYKDFGSGFYLGPQYGSAKDWALKYGLCDLGFVHYYIVPIETYNKFNSHRFQKSSEKWLDFVIANRTGKVLKEYSGYDLISGDTADAHAQVLVDSYIEQVKVFGENPLLKKQLLHNLRVDILPYQICVKAEDCLSCFKKLAVVEVRKNGQEIRRF